MISWYESIYFQFLFRDARSKMGIFYFYQYLEDFLHISIYPRSFKANTKGFKLACQTSNPLTCILASNTTKFHLGTVRERKCCSANSDYKLCFDFCSLKIWYILLYKNYEILEKFQPKFQAWGAINPISRGFLEAEKILKIFSEKGGTRMALFGRSYPLFSVFWLFKLIF